MDITTLTTATAVATAALDTLAPYLKKGAETMVGEAAKSLWNFIKKPFTKPSEQEKLEAWSKDPNNAKAQGAVEYILGEKLAEDANLLNELRELLKAMPTTEIKQNTINQTGDGNVAVQDFKGNLKINNSGYARGREE